MRSLWTTILCAMTLGAGCGHQPTAEEKRFLESLGKATITVYPTRVRNGTQSVYDAEGAAKVAAYFQDEKLATATLAKDEVPLPTEFSHNQAKLWRGCRDAFGAWVREHPIETDYAILAEFLMNGPGRQALGIHCYVVSRDGRDVFGHLLNSHHEVFSKADPRDAAGCTEVLLAMLRIWVAERSK